MGLRKIPKKFQDSFRPSKIQRPAGKGMICKICRFQKMESDCSKNHNRNRKPELTIYSRNGDSEIYTFLKTEIPGYYGRDYFETCNFHRRTFKVVLMKIKFIILRFLSHCSFKLHFLYLRICPSPIRKFFYRMDAVKLYLSCKISRFIFLYIYRPPMKPCPAQPRPGNAYLCKACIYEKRQNRAVMQICTALQEDLEEGKVDQDLCGLIALTPGGEDFEFIRFYCDNTPEPQPVFGKDYTERCANFVQNWNNDDYAGIDLSREANAKCKYKLIIEDSCLYSIKIG